MGDDPGSFWTDALDGSQPVRRRAQDFLGFAERVQKPPQPHRPDARDHVDDDASLGMGHKERVHF